MVVVKIVIHVKKQNVYSIGRPLKVVIKRRNSPLQARSDPDGSRKLRLPDFMTTAQDGDKVVSLTHQAPLPPGNTPGTHFC